MGGRVWQRESFDRILRSGDDLRAKAEYIANNPVRKGFVRTSAEWRWLWNGEPLERQPLRLSTRGSYVESRAGQRETLSLQNDSRLRRAASLWSDSLSRGRVPTGPP
jgi:hypothetical protein